MLEAVNLAISQGQISCLDIKAGPASLYASLLQPYQSQVELHSFDWNFLTQVEAIDPGFTLVALGSGDLAASLASMPASVDKISWATGSGLTASAIAAAHAAGKQVYAWTVNDSSTMLTLRDWGIDGIITDNTVLATAVLSTEPGELGKGLPRRLRDGLMLSWDIRRRAGQPHGCSGGRIGPRARRRARARGGTARPLAGPRHAPSWVGHWSLTGRTTTRRRRPRPTPRR